MHPVTRNTRVQSLRVPQPPVTDRRSRRNADRKAAVPAQLHGPLPKEYRLPGVISHSLFMPEPNGSRARRVMEPGRFTPALLPSKERPHFAGDPAGRAEALHTSAVTDDELDDLNAAYRARRVQGTIYDPTLIAEQQKISSEQATAVIDLDKTIGIKSIAHEERLYDLRRTDDDETESWVVRPGFAEELEALVADKVRLVLWTGGETMRTRDFFQNRPDLLPLFDLIITQENYFAYYLERQAAQLPFDTAPMNVLGIDARVLLKKMRAYNPNFSPKWISLLGYHVIADDHDGLERIRNDNPFGHFETVLAPPFSHDRPIARGSALYDRYRQQSYTIAQGIREALRRRGFGIP